MNMRMAFMTILPGDGLVAGGFIGWSGFLSFPAMNGLHGWARTGCFRLPHHVELTVAFDFADHDRLCR